MQLPPRTPAGNRANTAGRTLRTGRPTAAAQVREQRVRELLAARREVGTAKRLRAPALERSARERLEAAQTALGDRAPQGPGHAR